MRIRMASRTDLYSQTIGRVNTVRLEPDYYRNAAHVLFVALPPMPQTGDAQTPALFALLILLSAAGLLLLRGRALRR